VHGTNAWSLVRPIVDLGTRIGLDRRVVLRRLAVDRRDGAARVPIDRVIDLWAQCGHTLGDPTLPIATGATTRLEDLHLMGFAVMTAPTGLEALAQAIRFAPLITDSGRWHADVGESVVTVRWLREGERTLGHRLANENGIASFVACLRQLCGGRFTPSRVHFRHAAPRAVAAHRAHFRCPIDFGEDEDAFWFDRRALDVTPPGANPALAAFVRDHAEQHLDGLAAPLVDKVRRAIEDIAARGDRPATAAIARRLGTTERTLRRRLAEDGTALSTMVDDHLRERARVAITQTTRSFTAIALGLGFSDSSAFTHACRRWFGRSPRELRGHRATSQ
jgi:AraC-like DNA-binding protein